MPRVFRAAIHLAGSRRAGPRRSSTLPAGLVVEALPATSEAVEVAAVAEPGLRETSLGTAVEKGTWTTETGTATRGAENVTETGTVIASEIVTEIETVTGERRETSDPDAHP